MEKVVERFLKYVKYNTMSVEDTKDYPSSKGQLVLLKDIKSELEEIGMQDVTMDEYGYVFATLYSNTDKNTPVIGFIAHADTSDAISGENVNPLIIENYDGKDIILNEKRGIILSPKEFRELRQYTGEALITTDGTTLLGADDKAGIAEIITAMEYLIMHPEIKHGTIRVGFTPDEEIGRGVDFFDVKRFNADYAYTVDGGTIGELEYENFNAAGAKITIKGRSVHTGTAKDIMINSMLIACELAQMLPQRETPAHTEGYEGFYHLNSIEGNVELTKMSYILRDFEKDGLKKRKEHIGSIVDILNGKYGKDTVLLELKDQYSNMLEIIENNKHIVDVAYRAMEESGVKPIVRPIRGGTDGARLSYMGLPCPNLFTGGHNFHGRYEYIPVFAMNKAVEVIIRIAQIYANK